MPSDILWTVSNAPHRDTLAHDRDFDFRPVAHPGNTERRLRARLNVTVELASRQMAPDRPIRSFFILDGGTDGCVTSAGHKRSRP